MCSGLRQHTDRLTNASAHTRRTSQPNPHAQSPPPLFPALPRRCLSATTGVPSAGAPSAPSLNSPDSLYETSRLPPGNGDEKRAFTYFVLGGMRVLYATAARLAVINAVASLSASADVLALASVEVDLASITLGQTVTVKWRGKPVFIKHRTPEQIAEVAAPVADLRHQQKDAERVQDPAWLIVLGVCTHLGCVPIPNAGDYNGWYCPCHGSHYDGSGRIRRGPAPLNLEVPSYRFLSVRGGGGGAGCGWARKNGLEGSPAALSHPSSITPSSFHRAPRLFWVEEVGGVCVFGMKGE